MSPAAIGGFTIRLTAVPCRITTATSQTVTAVEYETPPPAPLSDRLSKGSISTAERPTRDLAGWAGGMGRRGGQSRWGRRTAEIKKEGYGARLRAPYS